MVQKLKKDKKRLSGISEELRLALEYQKMGYLSQAETIYHQILRKDKNNADALHLLGVIALESGKPEEGIELIEKAIRLDPAEPTFYNNAGEACRTINKLDKAIAYYRRATSLAPDFYTAHYNLGVALQEQGNLDEAIVCFRRTLSLSPDHAEAHYNLGNAFLDQGKLEDAIACYQKALSLKPDYADAHNSLGNAFHDQGKLDEAIACYQKALSLKPDYPNAHNNLGNALQDRGRLEEARECYLKAFELNPDDGIRIKLAALMPIIMPSVESIIHFRRQFEQSISGLIENGIVLINPLKQVGLTNFFMAFHGLNNRELQVKLAELYSNGCPSLLYTAPHCRKKCSIERTRKIKIGFISTFFYKHTIGKHFSGIISNLSREHFNVHVFFGKKRSDEISQFIESEADKSVSLSPDLETARKQIAGCELDVLLYTDIGMDPLTYFLAFSRLAPVQCVTWGHPDTTGIPGIDYYISCEDFETEGSEEQYSECLVKLKNVPNYFFPLDAVKLTDMQDVRERFRLPEKNRLYTVPQSIFKFHPDFDAVLGEILRRDSDSLLVLFESVSYKFLNSLLMDRFLKSIPDVADRIIFLPRLSFSDFLGFIKGADAVLDTPYFCGGTTSLELFAVGCPIVTWPGNSMASRFTYAYYKKMDIMDLVCNDSEQYIQQAVRLANDKDWKSHISMRIMERNSIFYNNIDPVIEMEQFFQSALTALCRTAS